MINIKEKFPSWEEIDKMIEDEFRNHPLVEDVRPIEISDPSIRGKYSTRLSIDEELDDINLLKEKISQYVNEKVVTAYIEVGKEYDARMKKIEGRNDTNG